MEIILTWLISSSEAILLLPITHHHELNSTQLAICAFIAILPSLVIIASACSHVMRAGRTDPLAKSDTWRLLKTVCYTRSRSNNVILTAYSASQLC